MALLIKNGDVIDSVENALQFISYYHPADFLEAMARAHKNEESPQARNAMGQILYNSKLCALGKRPICQDTGIVVAFVKMGMDVRLAGDKTIDELVNEGVRRAYLSKENPLRCSIVADPLGQRMNTKDNTPAVVYLQMVKGNTLHVELAAKGGGSENKSRSVMLNPNDDVAQWVIDTVQDLGAGWCPPGVLGIGVGGTLDKAAVLAKQSLFAPLDMPELLARGAQSAEDALRIAIYKGVNALGIGAQGLGGMTTVLDVKVNSFATHAASLPVVLIPNCAANRHVHFSLTGSGAATFNAPDLSRYDAIKPVDTKEVVVKRISLDSLTQADIEQLQAGDNLLLSGVILTGRDAAHKKLSTLFASGKKAPVDFSNKFIYYVGPVDAVGDEIIGPAGPTTATRMDKYTQTMLDNTGLLGMIGKAEHGASTRRLLQKNKKIYLIAVGGAAYVISQSIKQAKVVAFDDLGMEAIYEMRVQDMPVQVAIDTKGESIHQSGPAKWRKIIASTS